MTDIFTNYKGIISDELYTKVENKAKELRGIKILNINATKVGGGVAELLQSVTKVFSSLDIICDWEVITGDNNFFETTKKIHNGVQGANVEFTDEELEHYFEINRNQSFNFNEYDIVVIHDPQPLPLIDFRKIDSATKWIWRFHVDGSNPNKKLMEKLLPFINKYDVAVFTHSSYVPKGLKTPSTLIQPCISPFTAKNTETVDVQKFVKQYKLDLTKPMLLQVSRFDPWKDPIGVVKVYKKVKKQCPETKLILCGNMADDDPEGLRIYEEVQEYCKDDKDIILITENNPLLVNALQRLSTIVFQKSIREGFGLTISEGMYKNKVVVASNVGGIPLQIDDKVNGFLFEPTDYNGISERCVDVIKNRKEYSTVEKLAKIKVVNNFLIPSMVYKYMRLFETLLSR